MAVPYAPPELAAIVADRDTLSDVEDQLAPGTPTFDDVAGFLADGDVAPGLVLLGPQIPRTAALALADELARREGRWTVVLLERAEASGELVGRSVSLGVRQDLADVVAATGPAAGGVLLELDNVLQVVARARHDINNPLTTILAETQLMLLDAEEGELRESLEAIERQARRIRDLVSSLSALRPPHP